MLFSRAMRAVGLEIDSGAIRAVELARSGGGIDLKAAGRRELSDGAVDAGVVQDIEEVSEALGVLWAEVGFSTRNVVIGVANQGMFMRSISFPYVPRENLEEALRLQAGEHLPISLDKLVMDFAVLDEITGDEGERLYQLLLVAVRREQLQRSLDALQEIRLRPVVVDASPLALARNLAEHKLAGTTVLVDVAIGVTGLLVVSDGLPVFARVSPVGLSSLIERLEHPAEVGGIVAPDSADSEALETWARELVQEVNTSVNYYLTQSYDEAIDALILSGCGSRPPGVRGILEGELGIEVQRLDPLERIASVRARGIDWEREAADFAVGIGLAHRAIEEGSR